MTGSRPNPVPPARTTLRRLRLVLTLTFTLTNAVAVVLFAWLAIRADAQSGQERLDKDLQATTLAAIQTIQVHGPSGEASVSFALLAEKGLTRQCPQYPAFAVLPGSATPFVGQEFAKSNCVVASLRALNETATEATEEGRLVYHEVAGSNGDTLRVLAERFSLTGQRIDGAVVASIDAQFEIDRHEHMVYITVVGATAVILGLALVGHLMSVRAMRPAATTLDQQELFLAEAAHDLRTPVAAMRAMAETAMYNADQRAVLLPRAVSLAERMSDIIDDLLIRARLAAGVEELNLQPVRLDQLVAGVIDDLPAIENGGEIYLTSAPSTVAADYPLLRRAIGNLIDNARKYGHMPGVLPLVEVDVRDGRIIVADRGPGMHAELSSTPFAKRNRSSPDSTGLGLPIVRWVADAHRGSLRVRNRAGGGAVFELTLPPIR